MKSTPVRVWPTTKELIDKAKTSKWEPYSVVIDRLVRKAMKMQESDL